MTSTGKLQNDYISPAFNKIKAEYTGELSDDYDTKFVSKLPLTATGQIPTSFDIPKYKKIRLASTGKLLDEYDNPAYFDLEISEKDHKTDDANPGNIKCDDANNQVAACDYEISIAKPYDFACKLQTMCNYISSISLNRMDGRFYKDPSYFSYITFKRLLVEAGISESVRFHDLRHTHATWLLEKGVHPKVVAERLGHSSIRITLDTYSHVIKGLQQIAVSKIDEITDNW